MHSAEAEVSCQPAALESFLRESLPMAPPGSLFVGAGDSYAASRIASTLTSRGHMALHPYDLVLSPALAKGRMVYFVSASGRTASNVAAAKAVKGIALQRTAVTANVQGRLTIATDRAIFFPYRPVPRTPGTLSFTLSLLALLKVANGVFRCRFAEAYSKAERDSGNVVFSERGITYFLGNGAALPICLYAALKVHEFFGAPAQPVNVEEFGHAPVFALGKKDAVNIFSAFDPLGLAKLLSRKLQGKGFMAVALPSSGSNPFEQVFYYVFLSQLAVLGRARSEGLSRPYFVGARDKLTISDSLIY